jgi:predicted ATPase
MQLERIQIEGFKSFREIDVKLNNLNVLIGQNGAGKSNFISLFRMLDHMIDPSLGLQLFVAKNGGADSFLYYGGKITSSIKLVLHFARRYGYECEWTPSVNDTLVFAREVILSPNDYIPSEKYEKELGKGHLESYLKNIPIIKDRGMQIDAFTKYNMLRLKVFHFHDTSDSARVKSTGQINDNTYLRSDASNLAAYLFTLKQTSPTVYHNIRENIQMVAPFFDDFILRPVAVNPDTIRLEWREKGSDFPFLAHHLSDGTLRFICLVTTLLQPDPPSVMLIDEPELGLHPFALNVLAGLMRKTATKTQLIVSTQSTHLVNQFELNDLLVVNRRDGASTIERLSPKEYEDWLEDYSLGELWEKNVIGGRPS